VYLSRLLMRDAIDYYRDQQRDWNAIFQALVEAFVDLFPHPVLSKAVLLVMTVKATLASGHYTLGHRRSKGCSNSDRNVDTRPYQDRLLGRGPRFGHFNRAAQHHLPPVAQFTAVRNRRVERTDAHSVWNRPSH
jgi:hypothetical protein